MRLSPDTRLATRARQKRSNNKEGEHALRRVAVEARAPRPVRGAYCGSVVKQNGAGSNPLLVALAPARTAAVPSARKPCASPFAGCGGWTSGVNAPRVLGSSNEYSNGLRATIRPHASEPLQQLRMGVGAKHTCRGSSRPFHLRRSEVVGAAAAAIDAACGDAPRVGPTLRIG